MEIKKGIPVSPGYSIARVIPLSSEQSTVEKRLIAEEEVAGELDRFQRAVEQSIAGIEEMTRSLGGDSRSDFAPIFQAHILMLKDPSMLEEIRKLVRRERWCAEYAVAQVLRRLKKEFLDLNDAFFSQRVQDVQDIEQRLLHQLTGTRVQEVAVNDGGVIIASELTPSQVAALDPKKIIGIATDGGGRTDHTAIMARAMAIPAVAGLADLFPVVSAGQTVIIDGVSGLVVIEPDAETLKKYRVLQRNYRERLAALDQIAQLESVTRDGVAVEIFANIEMPVEVEHALRRGATGIGLFRTEFLYLDSKNGVPDEAQQYEIYRRAIRQMGDKPTIIRTLDLGGDKYFGNLRFVKEKNPFLGCRSIRLCLERPELFKPQLRAMLRAAGAGNFWLLLPMISSMDELKKVSILIEDIRAELREENIDCKEKIPLGIMVEIPSAVIILDMLIDMVDFVSIGTNDLVQYTLAVDRISERVSEYYQPAHPAILRMIKQVVEVGAARGKKVSLCGEMGADPMYIPLLLGLGVRNLSVAPLSISEVKEVVRAVDIATCNEIAAKCLTFTRQADTHRYLQLQLRKILPAK